MNGRARWLPGLALLPLLLLREAPPPFSPPPPAAFPGEAAEPSPARGKGTHWISDHAVPPAITGGSPDPPAVLPPARTCQAGPPGTPAYSRAGQVNGKLVDGAEGLRRLRRAWGDALLVVRAGDFSGADLRGARLHNICFVGTRFVGSDWRGARARGIGFIYADLTGAKLQGARMPQIEIAYPHLERVDATGADFSGGRLSGSAMGSWEGLRLDKADLRRFRFDCGNNQGNLCVAERHEISFRGTDLRQAQVDTLRGDPDWTGARLAGTQISLRQLAALRRVRFEGAVIVREYAAKVRLSAREAAWLGRHISNAPRSEVDLPRRPPAGRWMKPGRSAVFAALPIEFDSEARRSALYRRLMPAIVSGAASWLHVEVGRKGSVRVEGDALGVNDHWCSVSGPPLRLDRATGWFVGPSSGPPQETDKWGGPLRPVLRLWGDQAELYREGQPREYNAYFQCGARAFFYEMTRIPVTAVAAKRLWRGKGRGA